MSNILDGLVAGIMLFIFAVVLLLAAFITNSILGGMGDPLGINSSFTKFFTALNNVSIFIFLGMSLGAVLSALMIRAHPAFFFISLILVFIQFMILPPLVNAYNTVADAPQFAAEKAQMAQNVGLMQSLPVWTAVACFVAAMVGIGREM
jgi:hypothetical protein